MEEILDYLGSKGVQYKLNGTEAVIVCPVCNKEKLYINTTTGVYHCFYCEAKNPYSFTAKGHFSRLKEMWGDIIPISPVINSKNQREQDYSEKVDRYHNGLLVNKEALRYLMKERGLTEESINRFKLGYAHKYDQDWIVLPSYENGIPKLLKYRKLPPNRNDKIEKYIREEGAKSILFNGDILEEEGCDEVIIAEGEIDAITLLQHGYKYVVGATGGAGTLLPTWFDKLILKSKIHLMLDSDEAGQTAARNTWAARLGVNRCWNVILPKGEDINSYLKDNSKEELDEIINKAIQFKVEGISNISDVFYDLHDKLQRKIETDIFPLPWSNVNKLLGGGLARKRLTVLGGQPKVGKTSYSTQVCYYLAKNYNIPSLTFCLEMPETDLATKVLQLEFDLTVEEIKRGSILPYIQQLEGLPMYFGYKAKITPDVFYHTMKEARARYGIELGVFDNLQAMVRTGKEADIGNATKMFKDLAMELNIMFILVSQPRKPAEDKEGTFTYYDLKGSSAIPADADEVILLWRKRMEGNNAIASFSSSTSVIVDASRYAPGGRTTLYFEGAKSRFEEK
jgi:KaiC/GvpD/RAD55 family RecA-like ATPase